MLILATSSAATGADWVSSVATAASVLIGAGGLAAAGVPISANSRARLRIRQNQKLLEADLPQHLRDALNADIARHAALIILRNSIPFPPWTAVAAIYGFAIGLAGIEAAIWSFRFSWWPVGRTWLMLGSGLLVLLVGFATWQVAVAYSEGLRRRQYSALMAGRPSGATPFPYDASGPTELLRYVREHAFWLRIVTRPERAAASSRFHILEPD
ncbi:hypothetical protein GCM10022286_00650 [Gryllotalpicola daejeonensis]|uniref:TIGR04222 domain-containing membrane protein n=1 Tax=Gryllotalpicola daejeonensis TaxID=993087 RepID=A0ABP7ZD17_9MICO